MSITIKSASVRVLQKVLPNMLICKSTLAFIHTLFSWFLDGPAFTESLHPASPLLHPCFKLLRTIVHNLYSIPVHPTLPILFSPPENCKHNGESQKQDEKEVVVWKGTTPHADCNLVSYLFFFLVCSSFLIWNTLIPKFSCSPNFYSKTLLA